MKCKTNGGKQLADLKYVSEFNDRHGKVRRRFRRKGFHTIYLNGEPNTPQFMREYADAMEGKVVPTRKAIKSRSIADLTIRYLQSSNFKTTAPSTQTVYRRILGNFREKYGHLPVSTLKRKDIRAIMAKAEDTPTTANRLLSLLAIMLDLALDLDWVSINHARSIRKLKYKTKGFIRWGQNDLKQFEDIYPTGSRERLAYALLLYTGQRGSDVYRMNRSDVKDGMISVVQQKTGEPLYIPIHHKLKTELDKHKDKHVFILTENGKPYSIKSFQQWFVKITKRAGLEERSAHGLRKSTATMLAEAGCTPHEIQAITGHKTLSEVNNYSRDANQKKLAQKAMQMVE